jgi:endonuclease/exonuclease/phosphatase (EEP) superfamily protein YafD
VGMKTKLLFWLCLTAVGLIAGGLVSCTVPVNFRNPDKPKFFGNFAKENPAFDGTIKVVTFNIKLSKKIEQAINDLDKNDGLKDADIILLQEMDEKGVDLIARSLNYNYVYYPASVHYKHGKNYGNAILARWPLKDYRKIVLPYEHPMNKQIRIAAITTVLVDGYEILTYCVHTEMFWLGSKKKLDQVDAIVRSISEHYDHVIVGGDFNTNTKSGIRDTERIFVEAGFIRASEGVGATSEGDPLGLIEFELDHIFTKGMTPVVKGKVDEVEASDHYPLWVVLELN